MASHEITASQVRPLRRAVSMMIRKLRIVKDAQMNFSRSRGSVPGKSSQH